MILRLDPVIIELERTRKPVLVVAHNAVLRALYAYFQGVPRERCPYLPIPLHTRDRADAARVRLPRDARFRSSRSSTRARRRADASYSRRSNILSRSLSSTHRLRVRRYSVMSR